MFYGIKMKMHTLIGAFGETFLSDFVGYRFERFPCLSFWGSALQVLYSYQSVRPSVHPTSLFSSLQSFTALSANPDTSHTECLWVEAVAVALNIVSI